MAYNEFLAERVRKLFTLKKIEPIEKKMMGGLTFMVKEKMCVGILKDELMARIAPEEYESALLKKGCREMDFTGKPMKGFIFINSDGTDNDEQLEYWIKLALDFNDRAKASKNPRKNNEITIKPKDI